MNPLPALAHAAWLGSSAHAHARFRGSLHDPDGAQWRVLHANLRRNAASAYGRAHNFSSISSPAEFARRVPAVSYEEFQPWIDRIRCGESSVLTCEPVTRLMPTSGTTAGRKLIPFTANLQRDFNAAIGPWIVDLARQFPAIVFGPGYWSVSPLALDPATAEDSAVPIGFDDDGDYLGGTRARLIDAMMAVPSAVRHIRDVSVFRYVVLLHLLRQAGLRVISVWHPSFLSLLLDALAEQWDSLLRDLSDGTCRYRAELPPALRERWRVRVAPGRAKQLRSADPLRLEAVWPALRLVSCWADGHANGAAADLQRRLPQASVQPKGLLATEAFVTIPFAGVHPLAVRSHFFEFEDAHGTLHPASALRPGEIYEVIVTTGGGLFRYRLGDRIEVTGRLHPTPCLRFLGRARGSDLCGEKLAEAFVAGVLAEEFPACAFALLAPEQTGELRRYTLFVEAHVPLETAARLDAALCANPHYALCRKLGQLAPVSIFQVKRGGYAAFAAAECARGIRLGDVKPVALSSRTDWARHFRGAYVSTTPLSAAPDQVSA